MAIIPNYPTIPAVDANTMFPVDNANQTFKATGAQIKSFVNQDIDPAIIALNNSLSDQAKMMKLLTVNNWTARPITSAVHTSVRFLNNQWICTAATNSTNAIRTSPNAINWTVRTTPGNTNLRDVAYGAGLYVAVGDGAVMTSPDGASWTARTFPAGTNSATRIVFANGIFVVMCGPSPSAPRLLTSPDGITWTNRTANLPESNTGYTAMDFGNGTFVASTTFGTKRVITSTDGITWNAYDGIGLSITSISFIDGRFVGVGLFGRNMYSDDNGVTWTEGETIPGDAHWHYSAAGNGLVVASGGSTVTGKTIAASTDKGETWTTLKGWLPASNFNNGIGFGDGFFANVASDVIMTSLALPGI